MIYQFRAGTRVSGVKAQDVGEVLAELRDKHGQLDTEAVLQEAKRKRSRIHAAFEWDDAKAGNQFRLIQARQLIRSIHIVLEDGKEPAYVHISSDQLNYYQSTSIAAQNVDEWTIVHNSALRSLLGASENLDRLDAVARRTNYTNKDKIAAIREKVGQARGELAGL